MLTAFIIGWQEYEDAERDHSDSGSLDGLPATIRGRVEAAGSSEPSYDDF